MVYSHSWIAVEDIIYQGGRAKLFFTVSWSQTHSGHEFILCVPFKRNDPFWTFCSIEKTNWHTRSKTSVKASNFFYHMIKVVFACVTALLIHCSLVKLILLALYRLCHFYVFFLIVFALKKNAALMKCSFVP